MSRREVRDSDSRHHRSRFDREPSPKRSRRDGKPATERPASNSNLDAAEHLDRDQKHRRRLQDALPLEAPSAAPEPKPEIGDLSKESDKKTNGHREGTKHASDLTEAPRSRSSFQQHDKRGNASQVGRSFSRRESTDRGWWKDSRDRQSERSRNRATAKDSQQRDDKSHVQAEDNRSWRHDGYFKREADSNPPARKRPSFREKKIPVDAEVVDKEATEPSKPSHTDVVPVVGSEKREEKGKPVVDRPEKPLAGGERERDFRRGNFSSRDRYGGGGGGSYGGRERFNGRQGQYQNRPSGEPVEKWKHDLFDEANRSPPPKNEEEQIAKVEALLASS